MALLLCGLALIAGSIVLVVLLLASESAESTGVASALESIETVYAGRTVAAQEAAGRDRIIVPVMRQLHRLGRRLSPRGSAMTLQKRLDVAGNPEGWTPERILSHKGLGLIVLGALGAVIGGRSAGGAVAFGLVGAAFGFFLADILVYNAGLRRQNDIRRSLPDILDLLVVSVEAGLGFDAALSRVADNTSGPLPAELIRVLREMQIGKSREEALRGMAQRTSVTELRTFVTALVQASELGIPIGNVLREQAKEMRIKRRQAAEEAAQKLPVKIMFPVILCIFPALFVVVIGPGVISLMHSGVFR